MTERTRNEKRIWTTGLTLFGLVFAAYLMAWLPGCATAHRTAWVVTASVMDARDAVDYGLSKSFTTRVRECVAKHGTKTTGYRTCIETTREFRAMRKWRVYGLPAVNSAVKVAKEILEIAEKVNASQASTMSKVLSTLKDAACGIVDIVNEWKDLFPDRARTALLYLNSVKGLVCNGNR